MHIEITDYTQADAAQRFTDSLRHTGFGVLSHHPLKTELIAEVYEEWRQFFQDSRRHEYPFQKTTQDGYIPFELSETAKGAEVKDLKEFYHLYEWGRYPAFLSSKTKILQYQLTQLASELLQWIERYTPDEIKARLSMPLSHMINNSKQTLFRILRYPPLSGHEPGNAIRAAAHTDINLITLLPAATATGLQVQDNAGLWHNVECDPGMVIVNVGDMLQECTQGWYRSTTHQVVNPDGPLAQQERLSMPLFLHPAAEVVLSKRHSAATYLRERLTELGLV